MPQKMELHAQRLERRAASATVWSTLEILARYSVQFLVTIFLARRLTPGDFGLIAMLLVFTSIGTLLVDSGFGAALVQSQNTTEDDETTVFILAIGLSIITAGLLVLSAPSISTFFNEPKLLDLTRVMALVLPLGALASVPDALLTMNLDFQARARAEVIASLCSGSVATVLALRGFGVWSLAWQSITSIGLRGLLLWVYSGWRPRGRYRTASIRSLFGFGGYMLLTGLLNTVAMRMQALLIGKLFNANQLGYYTLAQNTQQAPASMMSSILSRVGLPVFSTLAGDRTKLLAALRSSLRMAMFLFVPCMVGTALVAKPIIDLVYGTRWSPAAPVLSILALSAALWPIHVLNLAAIGAMGRSNLLLRVELVKQTATIVLIIACAPWGPIAIAGAVLGGSILSVVLNTHYSRKLLGYGATAQIMDQFPTFSLSALAAAVGFTVLRLCRFGPLTLLITIIASAIVYLVFAVLTRNVALAGLLSIVRSLRYKSGEKGE